MMKKRKRTRRLPLCAVLLCALLGGLCLSAAAAGALPASMRKDGLFVRLDLETTASDETGDELRATFLLQNESCREADFFRLTLTADEPCVFSAPEQTADVVLDGNTAGLTLTAAAGDTVTLTFPVRRSPAVPTEEPTGTAAPETGAEVPAGGCGSALAGSAGILCLAAAVVAALLSLRRSRRGLPLLLAALLLLPLGLCAAVPAGAASEHTVLLQATEKLGDERISVFAELSYTYQFTEREVAKTTGMKHFDITYFCGPTGADLLREETLADIAACGFTSIQVNGYSADVNKQILALLRKYGLTCSALSDPRVGALIGASPEPDAAAVDAEIRAVVEDYRGYEDVLEGWYFMDEPAVPKFSILGKVSDAFRKYAPDTVVYINLFPNYATASQLGASTYERYLDAAVEKAHPHYLSYDYYEFMKTKTRGGFFTNMEAVRSCGLKNGIDQCVIILLTEHLSYANVTYEQLCWQVNTSLAYGMRGISYFTYTLDQNLLNQGWSNSCVNYLGEKYDHYYDVQRINGWLRVLGDQLFDKTSTAVFHLRGGGVPAQTGTTAYTGYGNLGAVEGAGFVLGFFDDGSFMIANGKYRSGDAGTNTLTTTSELAGALEIFDPGTGSWIPAASDSRAAANADGTWTLTFAGGDAALCRTVG